MEFFADGPAVLGGIMMSVALGAWTLGRWQGGLTLPEDQTAPAPHAPEEERAGLAPLPSDTAQVAEVVRAERRSALAVADSLGELHAEISAYRRAEQVLASPEGVGLRLRPLNADARCECRHLGVMGEPTCGLPEPARIACISGTRCSRAEPLPLPAMAERLRQPALSASGLTRV